MAGTTKVTYQLAEILRPEAREALKRLELIARRPVQGLLHGIHRSRRKGISTEFDHHKYYQPGDPLKHVDWKASARHDHYYVKRYLEDTALTVRLVVDRSGSMRRATESGPTKYLQAARLAACLAYVILKAHDRVGLTLTSAGGTRWLPAGGSEAHLVRLLQALGEREGETADSLADCLRLQLERGERRGLTVVVSDLLFDPVPAQRQLARLHAQGHEVLIFQLRDPAEEDFPFSRWVQFENLEQPGSRRRVDTVPLKRLYREEYQRLIEGWRAWSRKYNAHFVTARTTAAVETLLSEYLFYRAEIGK
jgi:uncharacterized protein (DUF58 family)